MVKKPRIVIIGAGMAGITAANKLYTSSAASEHLFELCVVEGGNRIGGRINTSEFGGDRIEMGATWIHGIGGSPVHKIATEIGSLQSEQPWECMDGFLDEPITIAEGGFEVDNPFMVEPISTLFKKLMDFAQGNLNEDGGGGDDNYFKIAAKASSINGGFGKQSIGSFLRKGLEAYWASTAETEQEKVNGYGNWSKKLLEEAIFAIHENTQRTYTSAGDLATLDYEAESEYRMFPGEEITIAKGYTSIIESLASVLPPGLVQLGRKVSKIEWQLNDHHRILERENGERENGNGHVSSSSRPVKLHFCDGSVMCADHVIVTVSLGVLKAGIRENSGLFNPPLPSFKTEAISRLGFGLVNKLFLQLSPDRKPEEFNKFPFLQMAFHRSDSEFRNKKIPWWMRKTASMSPIYQNSSVLLSWFAGKEALELETLSNDEIINGVSTTISSFLSPTHDLNSHEFHSDSVQICNGKKEEEEELKFMKVLKSKWGNDPLFLGSYSYVAVGSSGDDLDSMAEPLPSSKNGNSCEFGSQSPTLQILFAGEATHRTHYSTTHGAYFSGLREATRLLQHYHFLGV